MTKSKISVDGNLSLEQGSCRVIAEAGVNHNNSIERAIQMAVEAKKAGAWAVKYQLYKAGTLTVRNSPKYWTDSLDTSTQFDAFSASDHLDYGQYREVSEECKRIGISFFATPFDFEAISVLESFDVPLYKIASGDITYKSFLQEIGRTGKPVLLSTGASTKTEVMNAIEWLGGDSSKICPLVCTLTYPTPDTDANFARIQRFQKDLPDFLIGFSDHTIGPEGGWMVAALGGVCIEKHYTLDKTLALVPDHAISVDPPELSELVRACNRGALMRGNESTEYADSEGDARSNARRSLVSVGPIEIGTPFDPDLVVAKRPGIGIEPWRAESLVGKRFIRRVEADQTIFDEDLEK